MLYDVFKITKDKELLSVDYSVSPDGDCDAFERNRIMKVDTPHEDFFAVWKQAKLLAIKMVEVGLCNREGENLEVILNSVTFLIHKKLGHGVRMKIQLHGLNGSGDDIFIITPAYYENAKYFEANPEDKDDPIPLQRLTNEEADMLDELKLEAFNYAYHCKRLQPTAEEAAEAAENGGFKDERKE